MTAQVTRPLAAILAAVALAIGVQTTASAGLVHVVQTAPSPSTGQPVAGGGSWLVNKPSGYYVGRAPAGSTFDNEVTSSAGWHFGRSDHVDMCSWAMPGSMGADLGARPDSCSAATSAVLAHRRSIGRDFNAPAHEAQDGTRVPALGCALFYNYFHGTRFASGANGGHWGDPAGSTAAGFVLYRFTTLDGQAAVVRDPDLGWGFVPTTCAGRPGHVFNDDD